MMQKKLIALAVAGVMAAPMAAQAASAEVYGKARVSVGVVGNDDSTPTNDDSKLNVTSHHSNFGIRGAEALDNGMDATYQLEAQVSFDDDNATGSGIFDGMRNTYFGLAGDFGEVRVGKHDTPYKMSTYSKLDVWKDPHGDYNAIIGTRHDTRADNSILYLSPDMNGFSLAAAYITDVNDDELPVPENGNEAVSIAGMYDAGPLYVTLAYQTIDNDTGTESADGVKLGLGYTIGNTGLGFVYENDDAGGNDNDQDRMYFSIDQDMGNGMAIKAALGTADDRGNTADSGATFFALGGTKQMSKNVEMYAIYSQIDNDANVSAANRFDLDYVTAAGTPEASANVFAVGANLKFSSM